MNQNLPSTGLILVVMTTLFIGACSKLKNTAPQVEQQTQPIKQVPPPASQRVQPPTDDSLVSPVAINITSLVELTAIFDTLKYNLDDCTKNDCTIPHITFNKVGQEWQETSKRIPTKVKKEIFYRLMLPLILIANENIERERNVIKNSSLNSPVLKTIALKYRLIKNKKNNMNENLRKRLLQRVDILPPSLALTQAAEESGWGTSRFASEGNAFFGQWDFSGKGMKPLKQRKKLGNYGIARFSTPLASVEAYMLNINSHNAYQKLRILRAKLRTENRPIAGYSLAATMDKYSERGLAYSNGLRSMIRHNKLDPLDQAELSVTQQLQIWVK